MTYEIGWFLFGFVTCLVLVLGVATFVFSSLISRREEEPKP